MAPSRHSQCLPGLTDHTDLVEKQTLRQWVWESMLQCLPALGWGSRGPKRGNKGPGVWWLTCCPPDLPAGVCGAALQGLGLWPGC